ncbi:alpha-(1,3)-fucosyltransferase C-like [Lucilia cuprina]|uniref:alpha-(1,3)-fucosyltransferase C-like n=1 Tax=Lucilia cuprina TaxID=7375 RepID=UPI000C719FFB|nr:alpha-(1,3)-fucosyltransferase C-like [Lucilia cuprina]KAI8124089.1 3 fucosyltransferase C, Alpha 1 [Lucilia cuprina]KAI8124090.1 3 fucosyltransferase C, Alpha 1 [Lucilia cuprina]
MVGTQREPLVLPTNNLHVVQTTLPIEHQIYPKKNLMNLKQCKPKRILIILSIICAISIVAWLYVDHTLPEFNQYRLVKSYDGSTTKNETNKLRFILLWNDFFGDTRWSLPDDLNDPAFFRQGMKCPISDCVLTNQRDIMPHIDMYDAILFHTAQPFPLVNSIPKRRSGKQLYVFALMEPPGETKHILSDENNFYNLTMTYRMDSDILWTYNFFIDKETGLRMTPSEYPQWRAVPDNYNDTTVWELWPLKTKMAAWFVSHCETLSRREKLTEALQKYMEVDVFGKCGPKSCQKGSADCDKMLDENYKFYFSFENSLCTDYITEKLYNILRRNIIPIVYGGANYERFLPPHSYINVEDYETPQDLVNYLMYLSDRPEEYMRYFWWRQYYDLKFYSPFCDLCKRLHQPNYFQKIQTYQNIEKWWLDGSCRFRSRIKF